MSKNKKEIKKELEKKQESEKTAYNKKILILQIIVTVLIIIVGGTTIIMTAPKHLPKPEITSGLRGTFGIDKNINEETIDKYLNRSDSVYRDMRMLKDPGNYEAIGGDSYLSGFVKGFEAIPYPLLVNVQGLPKEVGKTYTGKTLFTQDKKGKLTANYKESLEILEYYFPKDKNIFLMCGGGGYAGMTKDLLVKLGWDKNKIYNVGGYWYYKGKNNIKVKTKKAGKVAYDFWKVTYHDINFDELQEVK